MGATIARREIPLRVVDTDSIADTDNMGAVDVDVVDVDVDEVAEGEDIMDWVLKKDGAGLPVITVVISVTSANSVKI